MITWGIRTKQLKKEPISGNCSFCGIEGSRQLIISQQYIHFFLIPIIPFGKISTCACNDCKKSVHPDSLSASEKTLVEKLIKEAKTPWWTYLMLIMLAVIILLGLFFTSADKKRNKKLLENPQKGDILEIKKGDDLYTLYKIDSVKNDSVYIIFANKTATGSYLLEELKSGKDSLFTGEKIFFPKSKLLEMVETGEIQDVDRN